MVWKRGLLLLCALLCISSSGCRDEGTEVYDPNVAKTKLAEIGQLMHIRFPAGTRLLGYKWFRGGMDDSLIVKVAIPRKDLEDFSANSPFYGKKLRTKNDNPIYLMLVDGPKWWNVRDVNDWEWGQASLPEAGKYLNILIDRSGKQEVVIYIEWFET